MKSVSTVLLVAILFGASHVSFVSEIYGKLDNCKDSRLIFAAFSAQNMTYVAENKLHLPLKNREQSVLATNVVQNFMNLDIIAETVNRPSESLKKCKERLKIHLSSKGSLPGISRVFIQACFSNDTIHWKFVEEMNKWLPLTCTYPQDSLLSTFFSPPRATIPVTLTTVCGNYNIRLRYLVQDAAGQLHGPYIVDYDHIDTETSNNMLIAPVRELQNSYLHTEPKRAKRQMATLDYLIVGNQYYVHQLSLVETSRTSTLISGLTLATSVDFHYQRNHLYLVDVSKKQILRSRLDGSMKTVLVDRGNGVPEGIAVDWINDKLYWATDFLNRQIRVLDLNHSILLHKELITVGLNSRVQGIAVDPIQRIIFWTDWYPSSPKIERASMDGTNRTILHNTGIARPFAITLDYTSQVIYWADQRNDRIECSNYDGSDRRLLISTGLERPYDITLFGDVLYWSDTDGVLTANKSGSSPVLTLYDRSAFCLNTLPYGIQVVSHLRQPLAFNPCYSNNGGCSHFCLLSSSNSVNYSCGCPDDMMLHSNMRSCSLAFDATTTATPITVQGSCLAAGYQTNCCNSTVLTCQGTGSPGVCYCDANCHLLGDCCSDVPQSCSSFQDAGPLLVVSNQRYIDLLSLDGTRKRTIHSGLNNTIGIDYHYRMRYVIWTDTDSDQIWRSQIDGTDARLLLQRNLYNPEDIAVDWISNKIYWTDSVLDTIGVISIEGGVYATVVNTGENSTPRSIVVDPINRQMYWTDRSSTPKIESASMDGTDRRVIHSTNLVYPDGITLDISAQTLYWIDFYRETIESSHVSGSGRITLVDSSIYQPFGITHHGGILYYSDWLVGISIANLTSNNTKALFIDVCERVYGIEVISENRQPLNASNPCELNNGGCSHLCLLSSTNSNGYSCKCSSGFHLYSDQMTCTSGDHPNASTDSESPTIEQGSCIDANYTTCCTSGTCRGHPQDSIPPCYCSTRCKSFGNCCHDFDQICTPDSGNSGTEIPPETPVTHADGCNSEPDETFKYVWPNATVGESVHAPCPCNEYFSGRLRETNVAVRFCNQSGIWEVANYTQCEAVVNALSKDLCKNLQDLKNSDTQSAQAVLNISENIVRKTSQSQNLSALDIAIATEAVVTLKERALVYTETKNYNFLKIIDNIQMADEDAIVNSQSSLRLLQCLHDFLDEEEILNENQTVLLFKAYAIKLQNINLESFNGQTFNVNLGSVEEAMILKGKIDDNALVTSETVMGALMNATGAIQLSHSESLLSYCNNQRTMPVNGSQPQTLRLSYSVYLSDVLFQSFYKSSTQKIGSLILGVRIRCGNNATMTSAINYKLNATFRTGTELEQNASSNSKCVISSSGVWAADNSCKKVERDEDKNVIVCECTKLGYYGILYDLEEETSEYVSRSLSTMTYVMISFSIFSQSAHFILCFVVRSLRTSVYGIILINMSVAQIGFYILILIGGSAPVIMQESFCGITAALLHYFILVALAWSSAEAAWLYINLAKASGVINWCQAKISVVLPISMSAVWLVPLLITGISAGVGHQYYRSSIICHPTYWPLWFALVLPSALMFIFNWIVYIMTIVPVCKSRKVLCTKEYSSSHGVFEWKVFISVLFSTIFGLVVMVGFLAVAIIKLEVLFCVLVGAHGLLIITFRVIYDKDTKGFWKKVLSALLKLLRNLLKPCISMSGELNVPANDTDIHTSVNEAYGHFRKKASHKTPAAMTLNQAYGITNVIVSDHDLISRERMYETVL